HRMAARLGFFGPEGGAKAVDLAECRRGSFVVQLTALREIGLLIEILGCEQSGCTLTGIRRENGRVYQREPALIEVIAARLDDFVSDLQDSVLPGAPEPEMPVLHQERGPVLLGRDWIVLRKLENMSHRSINFVHARRAPLVL